MELNKLVVSALLDGKVVVLPPMLGGVLSSRLFRIVFRLFEAPLLKDNPEA